MTTPAPQPRPVYGPIYLSRILLIVACVLFVLAAFAAGGDSLGDVPAWSWGYAGFAAWALSGAVP